MGKGFIYKIDTNENRLSDNIDVYRSMTTPIIFTGDKMKLGEFKEGDVFIYSDDDMDAWSGKFVVKSQYDGEITGIAITNDDVKIRATFCCDLIDTTTRQSLL